MGLIDFLGCAGWAICGVASFFIFARVVESNFGNFNNASALFFGMMAFTGPIALFWSVVFWSALRPNVSSWWNEPFFPPKNPPKE